MNEVLPIPTEQELNQLVDEKKRLRQEKMKLVSSMMFWFSLKIRARVFDIDYRLNQIDRVLYRELNEKQDAQIEKARALLEKATRLTGE